MPPAIPIIASTVAAAAGAAVAGASIAAAVTTSLVGGALMLAAGALTRQKSPSFQAQEFTVEAAGRTQQLRQPITPRRVILGQARVSGPLVFAETSHDNTYLHLVIVLCGHNVYSIGAVYLNDEPVFPTDLDVNGDAVLGRYAGKLRVRKFLGAADQAADPDLAAEAPSWTANHRLRGCAYLYLRLTYDQDTYPSGIPNISADVTGKPLYDPRTGITTWSANPALALYDYFTDARHGLGLSSTAIDTTYLNAAANLCDEMVNTRTVDTQVESVSAVENSLSLVGDLCRLQTGDRVTVTSSGSLPGGITAATKYYVVVLRGKRAQHTAPAIRLATSYANALAALSFVDITSAGSGDIHVIKDGEPRYTANGVIELGVTPREIIEDLLSAMSGRAVWAGGLWRVQGASWTSAAVTITEDDLRGPITMRTRHSRRERYNAVKGVYVSPLNYGQPADYPPVTGSAFETEDGSERRTLDLDLPFTSRPQTAQRLAKVALYRHRREVVAELRLNLSGMRIQCGDTVAVDYARFGWSGKTFEVVDWRLAVEDDAGAPLMGVDVTLRESDSGVYAFSTSEEADALPPASSSLPDASAVGTPTGLALESGNNALFVAGEGTVVSQIRVTFTPPADAFTETYELQWKRTSEANYATRILAGGDSEACISPVEDGVAYDVRLRSLNIFGVAGPWAESFGHVVIGKTEAPPAPDTFTVTRLADGTRRFTFSLNDPPDDVRVGGGFRIRYKLGSTSDWSSMSDLHTGLLASSPWESNELAAGTYTFACKAVDSSGNESDDAVFIEATLGNPRLREALYQQIEHPTWPGTKTNCFVDYDGSLRAASDGDWDDLPANWSATADSWDAILSQHSPITYETLEIDLGSERSFTPLVSLVATGTPTIEYKSGSESDGGVTGSWTSVSGQLSGVRYIQFKVQVTDATAPSITSMIVLLDAEVHVHDYEDVNTATETASWFQSVATGHIRIGARDDSISAITKAQVTAIQNVGAGWSWELINKSSTVNSLPAAEFKLYNGSGTLADATIDVELKGSA